MHACDKSNFISKSTKSLQLLNHFQLLFTTCSALWAHIFSENDTAPYNLEQ